MRHTIMKAQSVRAVIIIGLATTLLPGFGTVAQSQGVPPIADTARALRKVVSGEI